MFSQLLESRAMRRRSPAGFAASLLLHGIVVAGSVIATTAAPGGPLHFTPPDDQLVFVSAPAPRVPITAVPNAPPRSLAASVPNIINVPIVVPDWLPPIDPMRVLINTGDPAEFRVGISTRIGTPGITPLAPVTAYTVDQVEVPVILDPRSPLPRFPQLLKDAGVEGVARLCFVVDTLGRVELGSVQVVDATHPLFAAAVQSSLPRMHFAPARVGVHKVRQLVEFPVVFRLDR